MLSNSGGAAGFAGMTPAGGSGGAAYCSEITPPIAYDCSGDCAEQGALCDAVSCTNNPLRNYTLSATSLNIDEYVLPPHAIAPAPGCSSCQAITTATNMTVVTVYSLALRMRNDTASSVWFKVTSPDFGVFFDTQEPDQGICGSNSSYTQCGGDELAAGVTTIIRLYARSLPTPQTHWIHIEAHPMKWSGWDYCSPSPL